MLDSSVMIIDQLISERRKQGVSQRQLAENSGFTQSVIARLESKKVAPSIDTLIKVASALGCNLVVVPAQANE